MVYDYELELGDAGLLVEKHLPAVDDGTGNIVIPVERYGYNELGQRTAVTDTLGILTCYAYTTGDAGEAGTLFATGVTPVPGLLTQIVEDCGGSLERTTTFREFDAAGNAQIMETPFGEFTRSAAGHSIRTTSYQYDALNRQTAITNLLV